MVLYIGPDGELIDGPLPAGEDRLVVAWDNTTQEWVEAYAVNGGGGGSPDATVDVGGTASSAAAVVSASMPMSAGGTGFSTTAGPSTLTQTPAAVSQVVTTRAGKTWTNPANALGQPNGTEATISGTASTTAADSFDADLTLSFGGLGNPGGTRTALVLEVTHRYTPASGLLATSTYTLDLLDGATVLATLFSAATGGAARATLATDTYDLASIVGARTPAQIAALTLRARAVASLPVITGGSASWGIDAARIRMTSQLGAPA